MSFKAAGPGVAACCVFIALGVWLIPLAGLQNDEALFAAPLYANVGSSLAAKIWHGQVPVMVMTYLGSLKAFVFAPILALFGSGIWAVRLPAVLLGAVTIFIFFDLARAAAGRRAALLGAFLLATDPVFLLTDTFDWGPVAIDHVLLVTGCWLLFRFGSREGALGVVSTPEGRPERPPQAANLPHTAPWRRELLLGTGFLCFGLALWNKAIFSWELAGLVAGAVTVFWREVWRALSVRNLGVAAAGFLVGALPLVVYNLRHDFPTVSENARLDMDSFYIKSFQLKSAANGNALLGYIVAEEAAGHPRPMTDVHGRVAAWIHDVAGTRRATGFYYVLGALLLAVPLWWRSRAAWFSLVFTTVAWLMMAMTRDAGGSAHHVILLWPFPILFAAVALARIPWRLGAVVAGGVIVMNLLVINQHVYQLERYGSWDSFTDAIFPLSDGFDDASPEPVYAADWGIFDSLRLLHQGRLNLRVTTAPEDPAALTEAERRDLDYLLEGSPGVVVGHVPDREVFHGSAERLAKAAEAAGYRKEVLRTVADRNGRPVFEIYRFVRGG